MNICKIIYLTCGERFKVMIDHRSYTHNLSSSGEDYLAVLVKLICLSQQHKLRSKVVTKLEDSCRGRHIIVAILKLWILSVNKLWTGYRDQYIACAF